MNGQVADLRDLRGSVFRFVGVTSPREVEGTVIREMGDVKRRIEAQRPDFTVINTDGYVKGGGVEYKVRLAREIKPDLIICFSAPEEDGNLAGRLREALGSTLVLEAEGPEGVSKNAVERAERRLQQFHRFLRNGKVVRESLRSLRMVFLGSPYHLRSLGQSGAGVGSMVLVRGFEGISLPKERSIYVAPETLRGMFIGLGEGGEVSGFGHILACLPDGEASILTPLSGRFDTIHLSLIRLSRDLRREDYISLAWH